MTKLLVALAGLTLLALGTACSAEALEDVPATASDRVAVKDNSFGPRVVEVRPGQEVTWQWQGQSPHNVSGDGWKSEIKTSDSFQHRFDAPGVYDYRCTLHGNMTGRVIVGQ
jgi:plastocyanin